VTPVGGAADRIELRGLRVMARCGVLPFEQEQDQPIEVDLDLVCDLRAAGASDDLADTVDYGAACAAVEQAAGAQPVALLERLATRLADAVLDLDSRIDAVEIVVRKLRPPVPQQLATSAVRCVRPRRIDDTP
jgi:7,8-dihydroneopterin aldolase/epimerase/oxygenase